MMTTAPPLPDQIVSETVIQKFRKTADAYVGRKDQVCIEVGSFDVKSPQLLNIQLAKRSAECC
jgi:hypothetical protein